MPTLEPMEESVPHKTHNCMGEVCRREIKLGMLLRKGGMVAEEASEGRLSEPALPSTVSQRAAISSQSRG